MATCQSCGGELRGQYCTICGARAPEVRVPKKKAVTHPAQKQRHPGKGPGLLSPQRIWRTVALAALAVLIYAGGILTGIWIAQDSTDLVQSTAAFGATDEELTLASLTALGRANYYMEKGVGLLNEGNRTAAVSEFNKSLAEWDAAIQEDPNNLYAPTYKGLTYYYAGDANSALATLQGVLDRDPNYLWAIFNMAWIFETGGMKTEALLMYQKYIVVAPEEQLNQLKYAEQLELIPKQLDAAKDAVKRLQGGGSGQ